MMNPALRLRLDDLRIQPAQHCGNLVAFPLAGESLFRPEHTMLSEALAKGFVTVEEVSAGGSVPELVVVNDSDLFVLLLDGEELAGAKQNRVLNTTILLDKRSRTKIPVSCTEQGRWAYASEKFFHSGTLMSSKIRRRKSLSVSDSLKANACFASDQGEVWAGIAELHADAGTHSPTGAMKDAFEARREQLDEVSSVLLPLDGQIGLLVFINGKPAGCELFATHESYSKAAGQIVRSYAMDALTSPTGADAPVVDESTAAAFLRSLPNLQEEGFESIGLGRDLRYEGPQGCGIALLVDETPVHASFFPSDNGDRNLSVRGRRSSLPTLLTE